MDCYKTHSKVPSKCPRCKKGLKGKLSCKCGYVFKTTLSNAEKNFFRYGYGGNFY